VQGPLKHLAEVRGRLKSDATGAYNTKAPYSSCGGERVNLKMFITLEHSTILI